MLIARLLWRGETWLAELRGEELTLKRKEEVQAGPLETIEAVSSSLPRASVALEEVRFLPPVALPTKILAIGLNYDEHTAELNSERPPSQIWFNKQTTALSAHRQPILLPQGVTTLDYEGELVAVIGRTCFKVDVDEALSYVAGYTVGNDVSVREWQFKSPTWTLGKSYPSHCPVGPFLVTTDEVPDPQALYLTTWVNDELRQDSSTSNMRFSLAEQISYLSRHFPLYPGDLIFTGTPSGVGTAYDPPRFLKPGHRVKVEIEGLGALENEVVAET